MYCIGLTGGIGSGKSTVAAMFAEQAVPVVSADDISREILKAGEAPFKEIVSHFGSDALDTKGQLNRAWLRTVVFADTNERKWLENLLHPLIFSRMQQVVQSCKFPYAVLEVPLLLEGQMVLAVERVLVVDAPQALRIQRVRQSRQVSVKQIKQIIRCQLNRKQRLLAADDVILNNAATTLNDLQRQVVKLHQTYLKLASAGASNTS